MPLLLRPRPSAAHLGAKSLEAASADQHDIAVAEADAVMVVVGMLHLPENSAIPVHL